MAGKTALGEVPLQFTPTWVVAVVCSIIVIFSLALERLLHWLGKKLKRKEQNALYEALQKIKEELMLLGFISLLLVVFQGSLHKICVPPSYMHHMQPCKKKDDNDTAIVLGSRRRLLAGGKVSDVCVSKGQVPLLSVEAIHQLHIFIFILAVTHVLFSVITMVLGSVRIGQWQKWEKQINESQKDPSKMIRVLDVKFIQERYKGFRKHSSISCWLYCFGKQFYGSIRMSDYATLRNSFIKTHLGGSSSFNFYKYMIRALQVDFKKVVGLSWYHWIIVFIFLLINIDGWHSYFWISFLPLILLLAVGTKLEQVICRLAHDIAEKHEVVEEGEFGVKPSDDYFWFHRPCFVLYVIHVILFQNAFDIAFLFWSVTSFGWKSCFMGNEWFFYPRLAVGLIIQILCSYSTLPLYAIVTQMGSSFNKAIFDDNVQGQILGWANAVKFKKGAKATASTPHTARERSPDVLLANMPGNGEISNEEGPHRPQM